LIRCRPVPGWLWLTVFELTGLVSDHVGRTRPAARTRKGVNVTGMKTVRTISALMRSMPAFDASAEQWAAWLDVKADVFEQLAGQHRAVAAEAQAYGMAARQQARELRGESR
jgi:hypothetical protein